MMKKTVLTALTGFILFAAPATAQERLVTGKVVDDQNLPLASVAVRAATDWNQAARDPPPRWGRSRST